MFTDDGCVVYEIKCLVTEKAYIGVTRKTLDCRWKEHRKEARAKRFDTVLYRSIRMLPNELYPREVSANV